MAFIQIRWITVFGKAPGYSMFEDIASVCTETVCAILFWSTLCRCVLVYSEGFHGKLFSLCLVYWLFHADLWAMFILAWHQCLLTFFCHQKRRKQTFLLHQWVYEELVKHSVKYSLICLWLSCNIHSWSLNLKRKLASVLTLRVPLNFKHTQLSSTTSSSAQYNSWLAKQKAARATSNREHILHQTRARSVPSRPVLASNDNKRPWGGLCHHFSARFPLPFELVC